MFNFDWSEIALIGVVALVLIGPKDMPVAIRAVTDGIKKMRRMAGELQGHVDEMVREADLGEARDTLRTLRSMNVRGQVMRTIDGDGTLMRALNEKPLADANILGRPRPPVPASGAPPISGSISGPVSGSVSGPRPAFIPPSVETDASRSAAEAARAASGPPAFIPPTLASPQARPVPDEA